MFGKKWLSGSGDTEWTRSKHTKELSGQTFTDILNLPCDLDLECSNPIFLQDTSAYDAVLANQVWLQINQQFRRYNINSNILII